jgi:hypothetical protein
MKHNEFIGKGEDGVRAMRDLVFGRPISDKEWASCKEHWMHPDAMIWLMTKVDYDRKKDNERNKRT